MSNENDNERLSEIIINLAIVTMGIASPMLTAAMLQGMEIATQQPEWARRIIEAKDSASGMGPMGPEGRAALTAYVTENPVEAIG